jgi:hypothetical protein
MTKIINCFITFTIMVLFCLIMGCGSSISGTGGTKEDDFDSGASNKINSSIISIPENLKLIPENSSDKKNKPIIEDSLAIGIYGSIRLYINFSDFLKTQIKDFFVVILDSKILTTAEIGVKIPINDGSDLTGFIIEDTSNTENEKFNWKISFYYNNEINPKIIVRVTFEGNKAKGQMLSEFDETVAIDLNGSISNLSKKVKLDVSFDGTKNVQDLSINFTQDLTSLIAFAENNWADLNGVQRTKLDIGAPSKFSLRVQYDGDEYGISGVAYAAGSKLKDNLDNKDNFLDENRSTYAFRAKSITGVIDGAKMDVALPEDNLNDVSNIWVNDSFSSVFRDSILVGFNKNLNQLVDSVDNQDEDESDSVDFSGSVIEEQRIGFSTLYWFLEDQLPIPSLSEHGLTFTLTEFDAAKLFWGSKFAEVVDSNGILDLTLLNNYMVGDAPELNKKYLYYFLMAPSVIVAYQTNPVDLTIEQLDLIINKGNNEDNVFRDTFQALSHLVNPAFFGKENGLLGTFDGVNFYEYDSIENNLILGGFPQNFSVLNSLDLTSLAAIKPKDVFELEIEIK